MKIGELFIALGFDVDDKKLKEFNEGIKTGLNGLLKMSAVAAGAVYAINRFVSSSVQAATALRNFTAETGNNAQGLQKWQVASTLTNAAISADQVTASFKKMANAISDVSMGKGPSGVFAMLGVGDVRGKDVAQVMEELRQNFDKNVAEWGLNQTVNLMQEVGFDPAMLQALQLTRQEFDKITDGKILSPDTNRKLVELGNAMSKFGLEIERIRNILSAEWSPQLIHLMEASIPVLKDFLASVGAVAHALNTLWQSLGPTAQTSLTVFAALVTAQLFPLRALFLGLAAAINDVGHALRGLPSVSGRAALGWMTLMHSKAGSGADRAKWAIVNSDPELAYLTKEQLNTEGENPMKGSGGYSGSPAPLAALPMYGGGTPGIPRKRKTPSDPTVSWDDPLGTMGRSPEEMESMRRYIFESNLPSALPPVNPSGPMSTRGTQMNNTYYIQSAEDALALAQQIVRSQERMLNTTLADQNNGPRW